MFTMTSVRWQKSYPYRNEMMRLLLHSFYAIKVSFFVPKQKHVMHQILWKRKENKYADNKTSKGESGKIWFQ